MLALLTQLYFPPDFLALPPVPSINILPDGHGYWMLVVVTALWRAQTPLSPDDLCADQEPEALIPQYLCQSYLLL